MKIFGIGWIFVAMIIHLSGLATASPSGWAEEEVKKAFEAGLVSEHLMDRYQENINREDFAELAVNLYMDLSDEEIVYSGKSPFKDTDNRIVTVANELGIIEGVGDGKFAPKEAVTREQIATMIYRTLTKVGLSVDQEIDRMSFEDKGDVSSWAQEPVSFLVQREVLKGIGGNKLLPQGNTTREQAIVIVWRTRVNPDIVELTLPEIRVERTEYKSDNYYWGEEFQVDVSVQNRTEEERELWLGCSFLDPTGKWVDMEAVKFKSSAKQSDKISVPVKVGNWMTGKYRMRIALWDKNPALAQENPSKLDQMDLKETVGFYRSKDSFESWNGEFWTKDEGFLGRSRLNTENISLGSDGLLIKMPAKKLEGGEILTTENQNFGSYEIRMKLADAPSSITGFFLYRAPDFSHEIDIEVFNEPDSKLWLTTYDKGKIRNEYKEPLGFDPTAGYHDYRIDYYPDSVSFYIDGEHIQTWKDGFSKKPMRLMLNSWYPSWLEGKSPKSDQYTFVKWIKY